MGHIPEPKEVDFLIEGPPLTDEEKSELSEFIKKRKSELRKNTDKKGQKKKKSASGSV